MTDGNDTIVALKPKRPMTLKEALMASLQADKDAQFDHFNEVYAKLLHAQAEVAEAVAGRCSERRLSKLQDLENEAQWDVIHARAVQRWQINQKLQLLEELLHMGQNWADQREFFLLASARMDLERLEPLAAARKFTGESNSNNAA
jgi:hypothetical protein